MKCSRTFGLVLTCVLITIGPVRGDAEETPNKGDTSVATFDWEGFLRQWSTEVVALMKEWAQVSQNLKLNPLEEKAVESGWLGFPGASDARIANAEARLGTTFPPSYKEFLKVTNGWVQLGFDAETTKLWSTEEIGWYRDKHTDSMNAWLSARGSFNIQVPNDRYFVYGEAQDPVNMRDEYLKTALEISDAVDSAVYLLNPQVVTPDGEWEAWFFGTELPGATRYRSFREMMEAERERIPKSLRAAIQWSRQQR